MLPILIIGGALLFVIGVALAFDVFNVFHRNGKTRQEREAEYEAIVYNTRKRTLSETVDYYRGKKGFYLVREVNSAKGILGETGRAKEYGRTIIACVVCSAAGALIGLALRNFVAIVILAFAFFLIPIWRLRLYQNKYRRYLAGQLESGLSVITASYIRCNNIIQAVEENQDYLSPLIQPYFRDFLTETSVNPSVKNCIRDLRDRIYDGIFKEWCDMLIRTLDNAEMKESLLPILKKYSEVRSVQEDIDTELSSALTEYVVMMGFAVFVYVLVYLLNKEWFDMYYTFAGQIVVAFSLIVLVFALAKLITVRRPIQFKR